MSVTQCNEMACSRDLQGFGAVVNDLVIDQRPGWSNRRKRESRKR